MDIAESSELEIKRGTVPLDVLAKLFDLSARRIQQLASDGIIPKPSSRGEYVLAGAIRGYINFLRKDGLVDEELAKEKLLEEINNLRLKNLKLQRSNDLDQKNLIESDSAREQMAFIAKTGLQVLENLPDILERDYRLQPEIIESVESRIDALREQWAELLEELE
jgi:phage terminase Nu1 subunit (DNA packaging protein)